MCKNAKVLEAFQIVNEQINRNLGFGMYDIRLQNLVAPRERWLRMVFLILSYSLIILFHVVVKQMKENEINTKNALNDRKDKTEGIEKSISTFQDKEGNGGKNYPNGEKRGIVMPLISARVLI